MSDIRCHTVKQPVHTVRVFQRREEQTVQRVDRLLRLLDVVESVGYPNARELPLIEFPQRRERGWRRRRRLQKGDKKRIRTQERRNMFLQRVQNSADLARQCFGEVGVGGKRDDGNDVTVDERNAQWERENLCMMDSCEKDGETLSHQKGLQLWNVG